MNNMYIQFLVIFDLCIDFPLLRSFRIILFKCRVVASVRLCREIDFNRAHTFTHIISFNLFLIHFEPDTDTHFEEETRKYVFFFFFCRSISIQRRRCWNLFLARVSIQLCSLVIGRATIRSTRMSSFSLVIYFRCVSMWTANETKMLRMNEIGLLCKFVTVSPRWSTNNT